MRRKIPIATTVLIWLYRVLLFFFTPLIVAYLILRILKDPSYGRGLLERFGFLGGAVQPSFWTGIWIHAVSVGEVRASEPLVEWLQCNEPHLPVFLTCGTVTGKQLAKQIYGDRLAGIWYAPLDYAWVVRRFLRQLQPRAAVILETEIWPNLYYEVKRWGLGLVIANGRISPKSFENYYKARWFFRRILELADAILAESEASWLRYKALGVPEGKLELTGNLKFDFRLPDRPVPQPILDFLAVAKPEKVVVAASTMPPAEDGDVDEDALVLEAFKRLAETYPRLLMIHVPRKPERFSVVAEQLEDLKINYVRRSQLQGGRVVNLPAVLLVDTMGELPLLFPLADVVFVGGTLARRGGHNVLEPALAERPIVVGPHLENFPDIEKLFQQRAAFIQVSDPEELAPILEELLSDTEKRRELGLRARQAAESLRGVSKRAGSRVMESYGMALPLQRRWRVMEVLLDGLGLIWQTGLKVHRKISSPRLRRLNAPVVSVGGLAMGGVGKTPLVLYLAGQLQTAKFEVCVLSRGYRKRRQLKEVILGKGEHGMAADVGDEPAMLSRRLKVLLGVGKNRWEVGKLIEQKFPVDVFLLDDGFQHWGLFRDLDIVVIDGRDPLAGGLFPRGQLRESLSALVRANVVIINKPPSIAVVHGLRALIQRAFPDVQVFGMEPVPDCFIDLGGQKSELGELAKHRIFAFCGIGDPISYRQTLTRLGLQVVGIKHFFDHYRYSASDVQQLARQARQQGATALVTTEKDLANLPRGAEAYLDGLCLYALRIKVRISDEEKLVEVISKIVEQNIRLQNHTKKLAGAPDELEV